MRHDLPGAPRGGFRAAARRLALPLLLALLAAACAPQAVRRDEEPSLAAAPAPRRAAESPPGPGTAPPHPLPPPPPSAAAAPALAVPPEGRPLPPAGGHGAPLPPPVEEEGDPEALLVAEHPEKVGSEEAPPAGEGAAAVTAPPPGTDKTATPSPVPPRAGKAPPAEGGKGKAPQPRAVGQPPRGGAREERKKEPPAPRADARPTVPVRPWETEDLSFQVRYLGVPCGYARFRALGRVRLGAREAVHLQVRGWTSKLLSIVYPLDTTMDYYVDPATLLPLRIDQRKTERGKFKSSIAVYDQGNGVITYWKGESGRMDKRVRTVPSVHDPVTVVYNIRTLDPDAPQPPRYVYAGRKLWQVQPRRVGSERVPDEHGKAVETVVLAPLIRREGEVEDKGDIRVWLSRDARHAPLRIYAKIRLGTVEGILVPPPAGGGS